MTIKEQINQLERIRGAITSIEAKLKKLKEKRDDMQWTVMDRMEREGIERTGTETSNVFISTEFVPTVQDWDKLLTWIKESDNWYIFQRRISATAWRELCKTEGQVPGVEPFEQKKLNMRKVRKQD